MLGEGGSLATSTAGHVLLPSKERWAETPFAPFDYEGVFNQSVVATDTSIFVFGGEQWDPSDVEGTLTNDAVIWTPKI